jgi:uncharacterized protein
MISRFIESLAFDPSLGRQMRVITGPRQSGKTTLLQNLLSTHKSRALYYNWDEIKTRRRFFADPHFFWTEYKLQQRKKTQSKHWIAFDEIQKMPKWRDILKDVFDSFEKEILFAIAGSARLDYLRKSGDSLAGRYFSFHLYPLSLFELTRTMNDFPSPGSSALEFVSSCASGTKNHQDTLLLLLRFGGFPEPFLKGSQKFLELWHQIYSERLIREDMRDLTKISSLQSVEELFWLLPDRIGAPLSLNALREDLGVHHKTIQNYLRGLTLTYILFDLAPFQKRLTRSVKKERKFYFYDWSLVPDEAKRFENYVASELLAWTHLWNDSGEGRFELSYVRQNTGHETDFLIAKDRKPWLLIETKLSETNIARHHFSHQHELGSIPLVQIVKKNAVLRKVNPSTFLISADRFFSAH